MEKSKQTKQKKMLNGGHGATWDKPKGHARKSFQSRALRNLNKVETAKEVRDERSI